MSRRLPVFTRCLLLLLLACCAFDAWAQAPEPSPGTAPLFVNEGETLVYHVGRDPEAGQGTVSDALQNVPGVKVDTEGNISLRGVENVALFINGRPSHFDEESLKNYLQQVKASSIARIEVMTNPSAQYTSEANTGVINLITEAAHHAERHLSIGLQANTKPTVSPWVSYIWNNQKWSFNANLKGGYTGIRNHSEGYSYSFVDHLVNGEPMGLDTASCTRTHSDDTERDYSTELFLKTEYRPNPKNDLMAFFNISPSRSHSHYRSHTYRREYIDDIGEYDYTIERADRQDFSVGAIGLEWHHRFK